MKKSKLALAILAGVLPIVIAGCARPEQTDAPITMEASRTARTIESFRFIGSNTIIQDVTAKLGPPDRDVGSGLHVYVYDLSDGTAVRIGSQDGSNIVYVVSGEKVLFQRRD